MIEIIVKEHMQPRLTVPVYFEFPSNPCESFVVLKVENNPRENLIDSALIVADSYGPTQLDAARLNASVKPILDDLVLLPSISASKRGGDYPAFDSVNKRYRYQAVQNITYYEEVTL